LDYDATFTREYQTSLTLQPETLRLIEEQLESGNYDSADDVVRHALRALSKEDQQYAIRLEALRGEIQKEIDDLDNGRYSSADEVFARLRARRGRYSRFVMNSSSSAA
jgi:putative addiction module CopG family antidote